MSTAEAPGLETDPRFPSGPWTGFFLQGEIPGRHLMELRLTFRQGVLSGEGRDWVGAFIVRGRYSIADGKCYWSKQYVGRHTVYYQGYNEGKGIWGIWDLPPFYRGGFHIWPEGMGDPTQLELTEAADPPAPVEEEIETLVPIGVRAHSSPARGPLPVPILE
jgi:hypothetical protein